MAHSLPDLEHASRIVIKTGSALVTDEANGLPKTEWMISLAQDIANLQKLGKSVVLVSSGAVSLGRKTLGLQGKSPLSLAEKQASAACGQVALMQAWQKAFAHHDRHIAQALLTLDTSEQRPRYLNARNTLETLLEMGVIPIVNENDTVATAEIKFGDNDRLAARVAEMVMADALVILSDIDGFYTADPTQHHDAELLREIREITPEIEAMAGNSRSGLGSGGMITKLAAARIATGAGCHTLIAAGKPDNPLNRAMTGKTGTWFTASSSPKTARKRWIAGSLKPAGTLIVDDGAAAALKQGKSLLAAGVKEVKGRFDRGEAVMIEDHLGVKLGLGLIAYNDEETRLIRGKRSEDFESLIGYQGRKALIHRDDLVIE